MPTRPALRARTAQVREQVEGRLTPDERHRLAGVPVARMVEALDRMPAFDDYTYVSAEVEAVEADVVLTDGEGWLSRYYQLVLHELLDRSLSRPHPWVLPDEIEDALLAEYARMIDEAATDPIWSDPLGSPEFMIDVGFARESLLPFRVGLVGLGDGVIYGHLTPRPDRLEEPFSEASVLDDGLLAADFFAHNPSLRAMVSASWLLDPALDEVSPHLAWVRRYVLERGSELEPIETPDHVVENALATSRTRRRLYEEGRYVPKTYAMVSRRDAVLRWAESRRR
ncbi:MAG: hypothetical protein JWP02_987 [Acidimicrobiales bacterium]|nr:hypothetical protein [Acidimicrobiales bacterium]